MITVEMYEREELLAGERLEGPAIVEQMDTTNVVPPGASVEAERRGDLIITVAPEG